MSMSVCLHAIRANCATPNFICLLHHIKHVVISGFQQIHILVNVLLTSGYQPSLMKFPEDVTYFSKLNLPFLPQIMNEKISNIHFVVVRILLYMCKYITRFPYPLRKMTTSIGFPYFYHEVIPNVQHVSNGWR